MRPLPFQPAFAQPAFARPALALALLALAPLTLPAPTARADGDPAPRATLPAHEHGVGALNVAIEGARVLMAFAAPGADIVGFEHPAATDADRAAIAAATARLADPMMLFSPSAAAGCTVVSASVALVGEGAGPDAAHDETHGDVQGGAHAHGHDDAHGHDHGRDAGHADAAAHDAGGAGHSEFVAEYALACAAIDRLEGFEFGYFAQFPNAERLAVAILSDRGQRAAVVERDAPRLGLDGGA